MKFSDINREEWLALQPYLDTCLLPLTQLGGGESPAEMTEALEKLRDVMTLVERPFNGRVLTYPALHYVQDEQHEAQVVNALCRKIKQAGFRYVIIASVETCQRFEEADLQIDERYVADQERLTNLVERMWRGDTESGDV